MVRQSVAFNFSGADRAGYDGLGTHLWFFKVSFAHSPAGNLLVFSRVSN